MLTRQLSNLVDMSRDKKVLLVIATDILLTALAIYLAIALRLSSFDIRPFWEPATGTLFWFLPLSAMSSLFWSVPRMAVRTLNTDGMGRIGMTAITTGLILFVINTWPFFTIPRSAPLIFIPIHVVLLVGVRLAAGKVIAYWCDPQSTTERILIYGAGAAGVQLANALSGFPQAKALAFVDDNPSLRKVLIGSLRVHGPGDIETLIQNYRITQIILAMPSASRSRKQQVMRNLSIFNVSLMTLPHFVDFISGAPLTSQLRPVTSEDLLGRLPQSFNIPEVKTYYADSVVMVTGAGGSIGSELCRLLVAVPVRKLILYDHSEVALYEVERRLRKSSPECEIYPVLASVLDRSKVFETLKKHNVRVILHAAAYKHVPLVEDNAVIGAKNNVIGTRIVAEACAASGVERFILISTDKAVRPTNVMGATKRLAEIMVQDLQAQHSGTTFSMVRFGNVLGSSGSVIPLFTEQIANGGPITVTHPDVTRFFMTISEASSLVLLAGTFSKGGEVFLLDMGNPVKIAALARNMITSSGLTERTEQNPDGDIEIVFTGLRPGEKLYEELLIGEGHISTPHPKIMCARENSYDHKVVAQATERLTTAIENHDHNALRAVLVELVEGYGPSSAGSDSKEPTALQAVT